MAFSEAQYEALYHKIVNGLNHAVSVINHVIHVIEDATSWIPFIGSAIKSGLSAIVKKMNELTNDVEQHLQVFWVPSYLNACSSQWTGIQQHIGNLASGIAGEEQTAASTWQGVAGGAYKQGVSNQGPAVSDINGLAGTMSSASEGVANAGFVFYMAVGAAVAALIIAAITIETVVGAIAAIAAAIIAVATGYANLRIQLATNTRTVQGKVSGNSALPGGRWPLATTT